MGNDCFKKKLKETDTIKNDIKMERLSVNGPESTDTVDMKVLKDQSVRIHHISDVLDTIQDKVGQMELSIDHQIVLKSPHLKLRRMKFD